MMLRMCSRLFLVFQLFLLGAAGVAYAEGQTQGDITLLQPLGAGGNTIPTAGGEAFSVLITYFNRSRGWIFDVAIGFAVVWVLVGGIQFMISGNNTGKRQEAVSRITWAIIGLLILIFSGFILRSLNGLFFV